MHITNPAAGCNILLLQCGESRLLTKQIEAPNRTGVKPYDTVKHFSAAELPIPDLPYLYNVLRDLERMPRVCAVRGALVNGQTKAQRIQRTLIPKPDAPQTIEDVPRWWLSADTDHIPMSWIGDWQDLKRCAGYAFDLLPEFLRDTTSIVQASSQHGLYPDRARLHFWFWLSRPITCAEAKAWFRPYKGIAGLDLEYFNPVRILYTAAPIIKYRDDDWVKQRTVWLPGSRAALVPPPADELKPKARVFSYRSATRETSGVGTTSGTPFDGGSIASIIHRLANASPGNRNPELFKAAARMSVWVARGEITAAEAEAELLKTVADFVDFDCEQQRRDTIASGFARAVADLAACDWVSAQDEFTAAGEAA